MQITLKYSCCIFDRVINIETMNMLKAILPLLLRRVQNGAETLNVMKHPGCMLVIILFLQFVWMI